MYKSSAKGRGRTSIRRAINPKTLLISFLLVLIIAFAVTLIVSLNTRPATVEVPKDYVYKGNVSIAGVDLGGKKKDEVESLLKQKETQMLGNIKITVDVMGNEIAYTAADLGIKSNLQQAMGEAMLYAQMGAAYKDESHLMQKTKDGVNFKLLPVFDKAAARQKLKADADNLNVEPVDAQVKFDPGSDEKFTFVDGKNGAVVDVNGLAGLMETAINKGDTKKITAPVKEVAPEYTAEEIKNLTKKIATYTTSFKGAGLHSKGRVTNIVKMAKCINGQIINPGQTWSMNKTAGDRTEERGWALAIGIENGVYTDQPGGGVCQVSSTLYNAVLIAELDIVDRTHHSWPSTYIQYEGLDATISTGSPDLKIRNNKKLPVYIICYVNTSKMTVTVDLYGVPAAHGYKVRMMSKIVSTEMPPKPEVEYTDKDQNDKPLAPGKSILVRDGHIGKRVKVYKQYLNQDNKVVRTFYMYEDHYSAKSALYYENPAAPKKKQ